MTDARVCPHCGGRMVTEFFGTYGVAYYTTKKGEPSKRVAKTFKYELDGGYPETYCIDCRRKPDE